MIGFAKTLPLMMDTMMTNMIERVARAIYEEDDPWHKAWPWPDLNVSQGSADVYRRIAEAAIKAMREPTDEMITAGFLLCDEEGTRIIWTDMIDAALTPKIEE